MREVVSYKQKPGLDTAAFSIAEPINDTDGPNNPRTLWAPLSHNTPQVMTDEQMLRSIYPWMD